MYYRKSSAPQFWDDHWKKTLEGISLEEYYSKYIHSQTLLPIFEKYLPKQGKIIEGGCGLAPWVYVLKEKGYDIEGIDYSEETINFVRRHHPELTIKVGDVFNLDYAENSIKGYISLGVVEHFEEGPQKILKEAYRVLRSEGIFIVSVPCLNPLRRMKKIMGLYDEEGEFYCYAFTKSEISRYLTETGFKIIDTYYYDPVKGLKDEFRVLRSFMMRGNSYVKGKIGCGKDKVIRTENYTDYAVGQQRWSLTFFLWSLSYMIGHMILLVSTLKK